MSGSNKYQDKKIPSGFFFTKDAEHISAVLFSATGTITKAPTGEKFTLTFDKNNQMHSTTDCNGLSGTYTVNKDSLLFGPFISTLMFCDGSQESVYSQLLSKTSLYKIQDSTLLLTMTSKETMTFTLKK